MSIDEKQFRTKLDSDQISHSQVCMFGFEQINVGPIGHTLVIWSLYRNDIDL